MLRCFQCDLSVFKVQQGTCGDPVSYYIVEWDTSDSFNSAALSSLVLDGADLLLEEQVEITRHKICRCWVVSMVLWHTRCCFFNLVASAAITRTLEQ